MIGFLIDSPGSLLLILILLSHEILLLRLLLHQMELIIVSISVVVVQFLVVHIDGFLGVCVIIVLGSIQIKIVHLTAGRTCRRPHQALVRQHTHASRMLHVRGHLILMAEWLELVLLSLISIHVDQDVIFLVVEVVGPPTRGLAVVIVEHGVLCIVGVLAMGSILGAASRTWRKVVMLIDFPEALVASCLHRPVGAAPIAGACIGHLLGTHFERIPRKSVVVLWVLQVRVPLSKSAVARHLLGKLGVHGLREVNSIPVVLALVALEEVVEALGSTSHLLVLNGVFFLSLQLPVLDVVSCLLGHVHQLKCLSIGISEDQAVLLVIRSLHARRSLGAMPWL